MNKIMVLRGGSPAIHLLGNIGRDEDSFIRVGEETETEYIGCFEEGFGFIGVRFNKSDVRPLTGQETESINKMYFYINNNPMYKMEIDTDGNVL